MHTDIIDIFPINCGRQTNHNVFVCVYVCVRERETDRDRERERERQTDRQTETEREHLAVMTAETTLHFSSFPELNNH